MIVKETGFKMSNVNIMIKKLYIEKIVVLELNMLGKISRKKCEILEYCLHNDAGVKVELK